MIHKWSMHGHYIYNQHIITFLRSGYFLNSECALILNLLYSQFIHHIKITDNVLFIMLPYLQQLNFQLQNMIECPFQYYSVYHINKSPNKSYSCNFWYNFSHILKSRNRFFHHHFLTWFLDPVYACCDLSDCIRSGSCGSVRVFYMELPELLVESAIQV